MQCNGIPANNVEYTSTNTVTAYLHQIQILAILRNECAKSLNMAKVAWIGLACFDSLFVE